LRASELLLLGLPFGAARAEELGLVTRVVPDPKLLATATQTAQQLAAKPAGALETCKKLLKRSAREQMEQAMRVENEAFAVLLRSPDAREALTAFLEKRKPDFTKSREPATAKYAFPASTHAEGHCEDSRCPPHEASRRTRTKMIPTAQTETVRRVVSTRMPTRWGAFQALAFEREIANGTRRVETALALVLGDLTEGAPLVRIHSQCFTGEVFGSLRCDCNEQLEIAMRAITAEGRGLVIYEHQEGR